jgi:hypothetical protein
MQLTSFTEPILGAVEPLLRLFVDMAYTDRTYANVEVHTPFSLFAPPDRVIEALLGVPDALRQGLTNLLSGGQTALAAQTLAADAPSIAASGSPSTVPALHDSDFTAAAPIAVAEVPEAEPVVAQNDIEEEAPAEDAVDTEDAEPEVSTDATDSIDGLHPTLTSGGNKVTPIGAVDSPASSVGANADPVATTTETETESDTDTDTGAKPDPKPGTEPEAAEADSESQNDDDRADAAA